MRWILQLFCLCTLFSPCLPAEEFYAPTDFDRIGKIDAHTHFRDLQPPIVETARQLHFQFLNIAVDDGSWKNVRLQEEIGQDLQRKYPDLIAHAGTFSMEGWDQPGWREKVLQWVKGSISTGSIGIKAWKNIGMEFRDRTGRLVMIDDPGLSPIFQLLEAQGVPLIAHLGEPRDCWLPLDQMATNNNRNYFRSHPQYHMFLHPEMPSYESQGKARDNLLQGHPRLRFDGCHLAGLEWSVEELGRWLDRFPGTVVDMAARMSHLQHQTIQEREKVRGFLIRYQDRLLYGTDTAFPKTENPREQIASREEVWRSDWQYLTAGDWMQNSRVNGRFRGLQLPRGAIDRIYRENFMKFFPGAFSPKKSRSSSATSS